MEWYRWTVKSDAQSALDFLNNHPALPHVGVNALTGEPQPEAQQTTKWHNNVVECVDGKFGFPRVTVKWLDVLGIPEQDREGFLQYFVYSKGGTIEEFNQDWLPLIEEGSLDGGTGLPIEE